MSRKVILLGPLPPPFGGVSVYLSFLFERLKGRVAGIWAYYGDAEYALSGVRLFRHRRLGIVALMLREGRGARVLDATHFHLEHPHALLLPVWLVLKHLLRVRWYKNVLDGSLPARQREFTRVRRLLFRLAINSVDEFIVVSEELRRWLRDEVKVRQPIKVIPCLLPIPRRHLEATLPARMEVALMPFARRPKRVCSVGVFIPDYGFAHVAEAVERMREETAEDIGLVLLDGTFARDENYRAEVLRGRDWITVLENVPNTFVYQVLKRSDAFVRAFGPESYGISRVEATWCGLPVVATRAGETRGMLLYDFGDVDSLVRQLKTALFEPPLGEVERWAEQFRLEAEENLRALESALDL
ncbi:MAG: glycosyltransferase family 4 protein [Acidobacteria bacterium]|nr:glycosyltransferase family 4 protein [Acidobacteriota bacterium]